MFNHTKNNLINVLEWAAVLHLPQEDVTIAREYLAYNEAGLCLDHIATQIYEYGLPITDDFYKLIATAAEGIKLDKDIYSYLKELIKA